MKTFTAKISYVLVPITALIFPAISHAQLSNGVDPKNVSSMPLVCPLSPAQMENSIAAYAKMFPTFTQQPRCVNCHGGVDPFADPPGSRGLTPHAGGTREKSEEGKGGCNECHGNLPPRPDGKPNIWTLPQLLPDDSFVNRDARSLCETMKIISDFDGERFVKHIDNDEGKTNFNAVGFAGTRGLNEEGQALAFTQPYQPEPILGVTHDELVAQARAWVNAMGGKFEGDKRCGCEPVHNIIEIYYEATMNFGVVHNVLKEGPIEIPITFLEDHTFVGTGTLPMATAGSEARCVSQGLGSMGVMVTGDAIEDHDSHHMNIHLTNLTPLSGSEAVACPPDGGGGQLGGTIKMKFDFDLLGVIGEAQAKPVPLPAPGMQTRVCAKLIDPSMPEQKDLPCTTIVAK